MPRPGSKLVGSSAPRERPFPLDPQVWTEVAKSLRLSPQHKRIVGLLLRGMRDKEIAQELGIRVPTLRTYFGRIFQRVGVHDRIELILRVFAAAHHAGAEGECHHS